MTTIEDQILYASIDVNYLDRQFCRDRKGISGS